MDHTATPLSIIIIIIVTTCYSSTQPVLSSALQQYSVYNVHKYILLPVDGCCLRLFPCESQSASPVCFWPTLSSAEPENFLVRYSACSGMHYVIVCDSRLGVLET